MRVLSDNLLAAVKRNFRGKSNYKIYRKSANGWKIIDNVDKADVLKVMQGRERHDAQEQCKQQHNTEEEIKSANDEIDQGQANYRQNEMKIQMLSQSLYDQIFKNSTRNRIDEQKIRSYQKTLESHGIKLGETPLLPDVDIKLPPLKGANLIEHFHEIAQEQVQPYKELIECLANAELASMPKVWKMTEGWTRYDRDGNAVAVPYPDEKALIFDIEVCMREGNAPTMACAVGPHYWYAWCSKQLTSNRRNIRRHRDDTPVRIYNVNEMIPMESDNNIEPRIVIGHNVSFDRARIRNQYNLKPTKMRFLDTMSMHVCVSGVTSFQRAMLKSSKELDADDESWSSMSSLNSLVDVYKLYCDDENAKKPLNKEQRSIFVDGTLHDVQNNFQSLMSYCANDVLVTYRVLKALYPMFCERFPHAATLAGMLEIGMAYLPINGNWLRYINESDLIYNDFDIESKYLLAKRANQACRLLHNEAYKTDLWLWDEDWSVQELKLKKTIKKKPKSQQTHTKPVDEFDRLHMKFQHLLDIAEDLPKRPPLLPGYPAWYRKLCLKRSESKWAPGPNDIGTGMQIAPKLLSLCWEGYPLHYIREHGWGFLVPFNDKIDENYSGSIPLAELVKKCPVKSLINKSATPRESEHAFGKLSKELEMELGKKDYYSKVKHNPSDGHYNGTGVWCNTELEESCWFFKLPHKNGGQYRVGNPLARDFLIKFSENVLAGDSITAERVIQIARMLSYWRNNRDRIINQIVVNVPNVDAESETTNETSRTIDDVAAIIPQVVACGTLTRRASEPTWMTASNAQSDRIGSELRSMVQAPENYRIVGADVDSQELWIASVLGDASETGCHGATPLGWMTLNGTKSNSTDMHSVTAKAVGISRDHAKVLNYARIYGAGQKFAERLLKQFNPTFSDGEAKSKALKMFTLTKGKKLHHLNEEYHDQLENKLYTSYEAKVIAMKYGKPLNEIFTECKWYGGTESAMFNRLEEIAGKDKPVTPFLQSHLSRALEPQPGTQDRFLPTRINWVVQSGAVDFLHLMLVCMRWLMNDNIRFCLSFHDEIRYIVKDEYAYKAALAVHITNLLTRSFCVKSIGLDDLPQSIAFFTSVEVDKALRKEAHMDCKTPSNPYGLSIGYGIPLGESLNILEAIEKANGCDLNEWAWHKAPNAAQQQD